MAVTAERSLGRSRPRPNLRNVIKFTYFLFVYSLWYNIVVLYIIWPRNNFGLPSKINSRHGLDYEIINIAPDNAPCEYSAKTEIK